jgi:signal transduction histidine kinase
MADNKQTVAFYSLSELCATLLTERLGRFFNIVVIPIPEDLSRCSPAAVYVGVKTIQWPMEPWIERIHFFSGTSSVFCVGNPDEFSDAQKLEFFSSKNKSRCIFITLEMIQKSIAFYPPVLLQSAILLKNKPEKSATEENTELLKELEFRTQALQREKNFTFNIFNSITSGFMVIDENKNIIMMNSESLRVLKIDQKDYIAVSYLDVFTEDICRAVTEMIDTTCQTKQKYSNDRLILQDDLTVSWKCYPIYDQQSGSFLGTLQFLDDVTNLVQTERQLMQAEKMATIGTMLSGVAHELRNPLSIISGRVQRLLEKGENLNEWSRHYLESIEQQTIRCGDIVNKLLNFSHKGSVGYHQHDINEILDECLTYVNYQNIFDSIEVIKNYCTNTFVLCDRAQLVQAFLNLVCNAADAMNGKGTLTLGTKTEGKRVIISVSDTGPGIPEKNLKKIFDPFFTTKEVGKGTGLGLPIVFKIIQEHSGEIKVRSKPGDTVFEVNIPAFFI